MVGGSIKLDGNELVGLPEAAMCRIRGNDIAMVFQDPLTSLDPTKTIGYQVAEGVRRHRDVSAAGRPRPGRGKCSPWSACPGRPSAWTTTRTSSPAVCASA